MAAVPKTIQPIGAELAIAWADGRESYVPLETVRRLCPCAECSGERDLLGRLMKPPARPLTTDSFRVTATSPVGGYAVQIFWGDGHADGLYTYEKLREWGERLPELPTLSVASPLLPTR